MTDADDIQDLLAETFAEYGLSSAAAAGLAELVSGLVEIRISAALAAKFLPLRRTIYGEALYRELTHDDSESMADAARRLHCNKRVLRGQRATIRELLANGDLPQGIL